MADPSLRYAELIGQEDAVARLRAFTELFASSGTTPGHILLIGDDGMGQSTIAKSVATECGAVAGKPIEIQPLNLAGIFSKSDPPSPDSLALCQRLRIPIPNGANRGQVSAALDQHFSRERPTEPNRLREPRLTELENTVWFTERSAASFENFGDFTATVTNLRKGQFLLLSNLQLFRKVYWNRLRSVMRDGRLTITIGAGPAARDHVIEVPPFTLIATCPRKSDCPADLFSEFSLVLTLQPYSKTELQALAVSIGTSAGVSLEPGAAGLIARASDGRPGNIASTLRRLAKAINKPAISEEDAARAFAAFGVTVRLDGPHNEVERIRGLSGQEFESLITELLTRMGFQAEMTRTTGDGGIDIIAMLGKPIVGGRYLFQCKRFAPENLVGAPTVRDFYGAVTADRAVKGVFITTSSYTAQAREFAEKAGVELIDLAQLEKLFLEYGLTQLTEDSSPSLPQSPSKASISKTVQSDGQESVDPAHP